jgi:hypothetical protein
MPLVPTDVVNSLEALGFYGTPRDPRRSDHCRRFWPLMLSRLSAVLVSTASGLDCSLGREETSLEGRSAQFVGSSVTNRVVIDHRVWPPPLGYLLARMANSEPSSRGHLSPTRIQAASIPQRIVQHLRWKNRTPTIRASCLTPEPRMHAKARQSTPEGEPDPLS